MKPRKKNPIVRLAKISTVTVILWIIFSVYRVLTAKPEPVVPEYILSPVSPQLNTEILNVIQNRLSLSDQQIKEIQVEGAAANTPAPLPTLPPSASPTATPAESTQGGVISP